MKKPAWVTRMAKAKESTGGYHCSAFEANTVAREWTYQQKEIASLRRQLQLAVALISHRERLQWGWSGSEEIGNCFYLDGLCTNCLLVEHVIANAVEEVPE